MAEIVRQISILLAAIMTLAGSAVGVPRASGAGDASMIAAVPPKIMASLGEDESIEPRRIKLEGTIKSLDANSLTFTSGITVALDANTVIQQGVSLKVGDQVEILATQTPTGFLALRIKVEEQEKEEPRRIKLEGTIKSLDANSLTFTSGITVALDTNTVIQQGVSLKVGDQVEILATQTPTGFLALRIKVEEREKEERPKDRVEIKGTIESMGPTSWVLEGGITITITPQTRIVHPERLTQGARVEIKAESTGSGWVALKVEVLGGHPPEDREARIAPPPKDSVGVTERERGESRAKEKRSHDEAEKSERGGHAAKKGRD